MPFSSLSKLLSLSGSKKIVTVTSKKNCLGCLLRPEMWETWQRQGPGRWGHSDDEIGQGGHSLTHEVEEHGAVGNPRCICMTAKGAMQPGLGGGQRKRCSETRLQASLFTSPGRQEWRLSLEKYKKKKAAGLRLSQFREHLCGLRSSPPWGADGAIIIRVHS